MTRSLKSSTSWDCEAFSREEELDLAAYLWPRRSIRDWLVSLMLGPWFIVSFTFDEDPLCCPAFVGEEGTRLAVSVL